MRHSRKGFVKIVPDDKDRLPNDGVYRAILWALVLTVMAGAVFAIVGETVLHDPVMVRVGTGAALVAGAIYAFFRRLGARQAERGGAGKGGAGKGGAERRGGAAASDSHNPVR